MSPVCKQKLLRLQALVAERTKWGDELAQVKRMRQWILDAEHILDGSWGANGEAVSNEQVAERFDHWRMELAEHLTDGTTLVPSNGSVSNRFSISFPTDCATRYNR